VLGPTASWIPCFFPLIFAENYQVERERERGVHDNKLY